MRIVQAEIIIFHFPVGKFALAGGEFFPKGADIAAVLYRQMGGAAVIGKKLLQRLFESGGRFRLGGNGRYKSPPPNSRMPIPVSVSSGKPYRNSSSNTIPSLPKKMGYSRAKVTFQRYYSDVKNLTTDNLQTFFEGDLWIITRRKKINTESNIRLLNVPQKIKPPNYTQKLPLRCHLTTLKRNTDEKKKEYNHDRRVR